MVFGLVDWLSERVAPLIIEACSEVKCTHLDASHTKIWTFTFMISLSVTLTKKEWLKLGAMANIPSNLTRDEAALIRQNNIGAGED
ncbi:hypothetical protein jhhlp_008487 [Lomentospora prolificans]|uniref:Uncharacterized protein n=1 Tax=Lomentospora prolificans TaxID=41688 RepID=A0A2N3MY69_9PEZI|nr:hypothetical protein jhhlp_008487 [Lomentospora prolificans]